MIAATLVSFEQVFADESYVGPALLGATVAAVLVALVRRIGWSVLAATVSSVVGLGLYVSVVFEAPRSFYGLPTPRSLDHLGRTLSDAYRHSTVDFAPVPVRPGYVLAIVVAFWLLTTIGELGTFRWRKPLIASVPSVALFALSSIVGTGAVRPLFVVLFLTALFTYWGVESSHRLHAWGRWVGAWERDQATGPSLMGDLARRMGAICVVAALAVPFFLPALEEGLLDWRGSGGDGPGGGSGEGFSTAGVGGFIDPLVSIVPELIQQTDAELFTVELDADARELTDIGAPYWHLQTLVDFDGTTWTPLAPTSEPVPSTGILSALELLRPASGVAVEQRVEVSGLRGTFLPFAGTPVTVSNMDGVGPDANFSPQTGDVELFPDNPLEEGFRYRVDAEIVQADYETMLRQDVQPTDVAYTQLPEEINPEIIALAQRWTRRAPTAFEKAVVLQERLRDPQRFAYDQTVEKSASADHLYSFLFETRRGYCQQYATAFAVLARSLGLPTRVVVGFLSGRSDPAEPGRYVVTGNETHAWPEVYFTNAGWVRFEPTPRDLTALPSYTLSTPPPEQVPTAIDVLGGIGRNRGAGDRARRVESGRGAGPLQAGGRGADQTQEGERIDTAWQKTFGTVARVLLLLTLAFLAAVPALKTWRIERRYARARTAREAATAAFLHFEEEAADLAAARRPVSESARAYAARVAERRGLPGSQALRLAEIFDAAQYGPDDLTSERGSEARRLVKVLRSALWRRASLWERAARLFSPAGLLRRA